MITGVHKECLADYLSEFEKKFLVNFGRFGGISDDEFWDLSENRGLTFKMTQL